VAKRDSAACLIIAGIGVLVVGYLEPSLIGRGSRPYAYISVMAVGAMMLIAGALLWTDS
jgi:hypothetical protein